jgi:hypothetical protein
MRTSTLSVLAAGVAFPVLTGITACDSKGKNSDARTADMPAAKVAPAARGNIAHTLSLAGQLQPYQVIDVHPKGFRCEVWKDGFRKVRAWGCKPKPAELIQTAMLTVTPCIVGSPCNFSQSS